MRIIKREMLSDKELEYWDYVKGHIDNVKRAWGVFKKLRKTQNLLSDDFLYHLIESAILVHDQSKLSEMEFTGYRQWFYSDNGETTSHEAFLRAWNYHQNENKHHWEYWVLPRPEGNTALDMPLVYIIEMMMDWAAMSHKFDNLPSEWYDNNKEKIQMHEATRQFVEEWLVVLDEVCRKMKNYA